MTCANCSEPAVWKLDDRGAATQLFCEAHLPWFLKKRAAAGTLSLAQTPVQAPAPEAVEEPVIVEEAAVELPVPAEDVLEDETAKKRPAKKK